MFRSLLFRYSSSRSMPTISPNPEVLRKHFEASPLQYNQYLSNLLNVNVMLKRDDLLPTNAFKIRGALNKLSQLSDDEQKKGIVTCSAGNHAQGVAYAASKLDISLAIFMPGNAPKKKIAGVKKYGCNIHLDLTSATFEEAKEKAYQYKDTNNSTFIHPFDDIAVIEGQATLGEEILSQIPKKMNLHSIAVPIGGGGLVSGIGLYFKKFSHKTLVVGVEHDKSAAMHKSILQGKLVTLENIDTFADGTAVATPGKLTYEICKEVLCRSLCSPKYQITQAMYLLKIATGREFEPAAALSLSGLIEHISSLPKNSISKNDVFVVVCSGANVDAKVFQEETQKHIAEPVDYVNQKALVQSRNKSALFSRIG